MMFSGRLPIRRAQLILALAIGLASMLFTVVPASAAPPDLRKPSPPLTAQWWQSFMPLNQGPSALDRCDVGTADVVFLAGTASSEPANRSCTISSRKSILVPLINVECSTIEGNGRTPAELRSCARDFADAFTNLTLVIDGVAVPNLTRLRVGSNVFSFTMAQNNPFGTVPNPDAPLPATTRSVADGYWVLIRPLSVGTHTITFGGEYPPGDFSTQVTYRLTVQ
jgi:hypothetical protein